MATISYIYFSYLTHLPPFFAYLSRNFKMKNPQTVQPKDVEMEDVENEGDFKKIDTKNLSAISLSAINNNLRNATNQFNDFATKKTASTGFFNIALVNKSLSIFFVILLNI